MARRRATKLRLVPAPSVPAKPKPVFAVERFYDVARDIKPLFRKHWLELGRNRDVVPLDPHWDAFANMDNAGILKIITARLNDELVGYFFVIVCGHLHYKSTLHGNVDMYWLDPTYRKGWTGVAFIRAMEREMRKLGVVRLYMAENVMFKNKRGRRMRSLLQALGFKVADINFGKLL
jgi:GNAT superfamily N-acetyltransferase